MDRRTFLAAAAGGAALLAGCGDAAGTEGPRPSTADPTPTPTPTATRVPADPMTVAVVDALRRSYTVSVHAVQGELTGLRVFYADGSTRTVEGTDLAEADLAGAVSLAPVGPTPYSVTLDDNAGETTGASFGGGGVTTALVYAVTVDTDDGPALGGWDVVTCDDGDSVHRVDIGVAEGRFVTRGVTCAGVGG